MSNVSKTRGDKKSMRDPAVIKFWAPIFIIVIVLIFIVAQLSASALRKSLKIAIFKSETQ